MGALSRERGGAAPGYASRARRGSNFAKSDATARVPKLALARPQRMPCSPRSSAAKRSVDTSAKWVAAFGSRTRSAT
jgi:hypothetical protein